MGNIPPVTRNILIINAIVFLCSFVFDPNDVVYYMGLHSFALGGFNIYQLVTHMFTHVGFSHIFFNMFAVYMFGGLLERVWGPKRYLLYYMVTGIGAGLVQLFVYYLTGTYAVAIGASGAVFGLLLAFGMLFPNAPLYIMFIPIPIKAKYMVIGYGLVELFMGVSNRVGDNVAHFAHLGGMLFGIFMILYWKKKGIGNGNYF